MFPMFHMGLILPNCGLFLWPLKKGGTIFKKFPLPRGDLGLSSSLKVTGLEGPDAGGLGPGFWSAVSGLLTGSGELGSYNGLLGT